MKNNPRLFVLGLDGATRELVNRPQLPNLQKLCAAGLFGPLLSRPAVTPIAWTSLVTGVNPGKHGIFGFRQGDKLLSSKDKKTPELWDYLKTLSVNIPMTYPARETSGLMIGGMMTPDLDSPEAVYPKREISYLKSIDYQIEPEINLADIEKSLQARIKLTKEYAQKKDFQVFFHVFREFDSLQHFFWGQDLPFYKLIDDLLAWLWEKFPQDYFAVVSDHGFTHVAKAFNPEVWLNRYFPQKAHIGGWGAIYLDDLAVKEKIIKSLNELKHKGQKVTLVFAKEDLYHGPQTKFAPDIIISPLRENGFTFGVGDSPVFSKTPKTGCHTEQAVFALAGPGIKPQKISGTLYDLLPTILKLFHLPIPKNLDGRSFL